ncbi:MAG: protoheme IX farnesyltransferase [Candidatus Mycalebacterium zealandia]|nr:MAG: protoheme IX farnesyltransferase [Candidatus Mycalebacterium zealandia]
MKNPIREIVVSTVILSKPGIILSVVFTGFAGMVLSQKGIPAPGIALLGCLTLMASAAGAAIFNNFLDRKSDKLMNRLSARVSALERLGEENSVIVSWTMIAGATVASAIWINALNAFLIVLAAVSYTVLYTMFLKRNSPFGTVLGGIPGALPVLIGYTAIRPVIETEAIILFTFMMLWQPPHFWALAQKYSGEYEKAGIAVLPVAFGEKYTNILIILYSISLIPLTLIMSLMGITSGYFAAVALALGVYFNITVVKCAIANKGYEGAFGASIVYMLLIMTALIVDIAMRQREIDRLMEFV